MLAKTLVILFLIIILYSLGSALFYLVRAKPDSDRVVVALTWRIGLSLLLFCLLIIGYWLGWIKPHGI